MNTSWPVIIVSFLFAACTNDSNLLTDQSTSGATSTDPEVGLHYFLPRGEIRMVGTNEKTDAGTAFKITTTRLIVPNRTELCFLKYRHNVLYDDDLTLEVDDNGLLKTVNSTSTDQTPAIIENLAETAINLFKIEAQLSGGRMKPQPTPHPFVYTFDPLNDKERRAAIAFLANQIGINLEVETTAGVDVGKAVVSQRTNISTDGVLYHPPLVVKLRFSIGTDSSDVAVHVMPDPSVTHCLSMRRASLVAQQTSLTFTNGMLTHVGFKRPSQALAGVQIPLTITQKAVQAIPEIIKIRNEAATQEIQNKTALLDAQQKYLQAQIDLQKEQAELKSLREKSHQPPPPPTTPDGTARVEPAPEATPIP